MRVKLKENKQKELICFIKTQHSFTWKEFAEYLNVKPEALKEWYLENCLLPLETFKKLNKGHTFDKFLIEVKDEHWGQSLGGTVSLGSTKFINKPEKSGELSEFIGIVLGDGNINLYKKGKNIGTYSLRICGHSEYDFEYLTGFISPLIIKLFHVEPKFYSSKISKALYVIVNSKELINFLVGMGLANGNKIKNKVSIPRWITEDIKYSRACLRGLIDTDGSIFRMSQRDSNLIRISFKNHNLALLQNVRKVFLDLGFHPSKIINGETIFLSRQKDIENYISTIGFHNPKHLIRLEKIAP